MGRNRWTLFQAVMYSRTKSVMLAHRNQACEISRVECCCILCQAQRWGDQAPLQHLSLWCGEASFSFICDVAHYLSLQDDGLIQSNLQHCSSVSYWVLIKQNPANLVHDPPPSNLSMSTVPKSWLRIARKILVCMYTSLPCATADRDTSWVKDMIDAVTFSGRSNGL